MRGNIDWKDVDSWNAMTNLVPADEQGNRVVGEAITLSTKNCYFHSESRVIAAIDLEDLIVVDTPDVLLISRSDQVDRVKEVVAQLNKNGHVFTHSYSTAVRPWGNYRVLEEGLGF